MVLGVRTWQDAASAVAVAATLLGAMAGIVWFVVDAKVDPLRAEMHLEHAGLRADIAELRQDVRELRTALLAHLENHPTN